MFRVSRPETVVKTCLDCTYGRYHPARPGELESPPEAAYCTCAHPRVLREAVYDPNCPPDTFNCRYWLQSDGSDAPGLDADVMPFGAWLDCWRVNQSGELAAL